MPDLVIISLGVLSGLVVACIGIVVAVRVARRHASAERDAAVEMALQTMLADRDVAAQSAMQSALQTAMQSMSGDRDAAVQAAVETVLQVAGDKFADQQVSSGRELDLRSRTIAEQVAGLNQSFELQVTGLNRTFEQQLAGMNGELRRVGQLVDDLQRERASQHSQVVESIEQAARQTASLSEVTQGLREALANSRARGQWGERMADDVLRAAGFVEGVNYHKQVQLPGGGRPDITFVLPNDRNLHMDVKFPIDNYLRYLDEARATPESSAATAARAQFLKDVRQRVKEVTTRDYIDPDTTLGYVLLFIPNEAVYGFVHEHDPQLVDAAMGQRVVLCSPFTLFAVLGVVRQAVESVQLQRTSDEILRCLGQFESQWMKFSDSLDTLGKRFESTQRAFDDLTGTRRRQLQRSLDEVDRLRAARGQVLEGPELPVAHELDGRRGGDAVESDSDPADADLADSEPPDGPEDGIEPVTPALAAVPGGHPQRGVYQPDPSRIPRLRPIRGR